MHTPSTDVTPATRFKIIVGAQTTTTSHSLKTHLRSGASSTPILAIDLPGNMVYLPVQYLVCPYICSTYVVVWKYLFGCHAGQLLLILSMIKPESPSPYGTLCKHDKSGQSIYKGCHGLGHPGGFSIRKECRNHGRTCIVPICWSNNCRSHVMVFPLRSIREPSDRLMTFEMVL